MLPSPSASPPCGSNTAATISFVDTNGKRLRTDAGTSVVPATPADPATHGSELSALLDLHKARRAELRSLPAEVQVEITRYLAPRHICLYADAFDPSVVPAPERSAAAMCVRVAEARSLKELEACVGEAAELHPCTRHAPVHAALCLLRDKLSWRLMPDERARVEALVDRCLELAREMPPFQAVRIVRKCGFLRFASTTKQTGDALELAARVRNDVRRLLAGDRLRALREAMMFVGFHLHLGAPHTTPGKQLHLVVNACLEQSDLLALEQREELIRHVTGTVGEWQQRMGGPWPEVDQPLMSRIAALPVASLPRAVTPHGSTFVRIVADLLALAPMAERGAFIDQLIDNPPRETDDHSESLFNIACLLRMLPPDQVVDRLANIAVTAETLPSHQRYRKRILDKLGTDLPSLALSNFDFDVAMVLLAQQAPLVLQSARQLGEFRARLRILLCLVTPALQAELGQMIDGEVSSQTPP
ncbi:hypothetical protein [Xylophilus sp. GOD-11R]|uniref:hypothetical protein n=1 Tax=Xylophilus sp. GOD-11R TaxID=3089814 RepID=UPI00298C4377|nr:hypothetical protein [Xylophilus sp. GOD-11R]WPB56762.1 hypothetical protein R9X41_21915 [Xylophilus sp. GOD-11R]